jgi:hypothetical protein
MGVRRVLLLTAAAALAALAGAAPAQERGGGGRAFESRAFAHRPHLHKASQEECVLCHVSEVPAKPAGERSFADFGRCGRCHANEKSIQVTQRSVAGTARFPRFTHEKHASLACAGCHEYDRARDAFGSPRDRTVCAKCHGAHDTARPYYAGDGRCGTCHLEPKVALLGAARGGGFSHRRHLPAERPAVLADCARCHEGALASLDLRDGKLAAAKDEVCRRCHIPADPGAAPSTIVARVETLDRTLTEFPHAAHAAKLDCAACHALGKDDRFAFAEAVSKLPRYEGCISCHEHRAWAVADHGRPIACGRCHEPGSPAVRVEGYEKVGLGAVSFEAVAHPFLGERDMTEACGACHYRAREEIRSGITARRFSHALHRSERCETCHAALARSSTPADSGAIDLAAACARCHRGDPPRAAGAAPRTVRSPPFSHASHLAAAARRPALERGCAACHDLDLAADAVRTPEDVATCRRCHDHKRHADVTGQDLDKCIRCHTGDSLTREGPIVTVALARVERAAHPRQRHDMGGECARCHAPAPVPVERPGTALVRHRNDPHVGLALDSCGKCHVVPKGF